MSISQTSLIRNLRLTVTVFGALLFALIIFAVTRPAHAATSYVTSGTITLCHAGSGATNTWNTLGVNATIPSGNFGMTFQVQTATSCSATPGAFTGKVFTVTNQTPQDLTSATSPSKALFIQITLTGDGTNTPVLNSATLVDTPGSTTDTTPPTVSLSSPGSGSQSGTITLSATATDNTGGSGVAKVDFREASGTCSASSTLIGSDTTASGTTYTTSWDTTAVANGTYSVCAIATDVAGNVSTPSSQSVVVNNTPTGDTTPPTSTMTSPGTGALSGTVTLSATSTDNSGGSGVAKVDFRDVASTGTCSASSALIGSATSPASGSTYSVSWNTASVANGSYKVCSIATDKAGNVQATPSSQTVTVSNTTSSTGTTAWVSPANGATVPVQATNTITANTSGYTPGISSVIFKDGSTTIGTDTSGTSANGGNNWSVNWNTSAITAGSSHTLTATATNSSGTAQTPVSVTVTVGTAVVTPPPDTQPPTAPSGLTATASSSTDVHLAWTASTDNVGVTGYNIYRNGSATAMATTASTTYDDTTVSPTTNYTYTVKAFDAAGNLSTASNTASVTTPCSGDCVAPSVPTNLTGTAATVGSPASSVKVSLTWTASTDNVGVTGYVVLRGGVVIATGVTSPSYVDTTVQPNTSYTYTVEAKDAAGNVSAASSGFTVKTPTIGDTQAPTVPQNVTATAISASQVNVSWTASTDNVGVADYIVLRNGVQVGTSTTTTYGDATVAASTTYNYTVEAVDAAGNTSASSAAASVTTPAPVTTSSGDLPVYRLTTPNGGHFWTSSPAELTYAITQLGYSLEGVAYYSFASGHTPVYRLATPKEQLSGGHFWTDNVAELNYVIANLGYVLEGVAFDEDATQLNGDVPVYRLSIPAGGHFWTDSTAEATYVETNLGYVMEGVAWYAPTN